MQEFRPRRRKNNDDEIEEMPETEKKDLSDIDKLLEEIDEVLDTEAQQEIEHARFRDKVRSINFILPGRRHLYHGTDPCAEYRAWRDRMMAKGYVPCPPGTPGAVAYDGPPCVDC